MRVLCFDPSGNFSKNEGKGCSGWALFVDGELESFGDIAASDYDSLEEYFVRHRHLIELKAPNKIIIESFKLQPGKAMQQSWSAMETPQLIGYLRMIAYGNLIDVVFQDPKDKIRVADPILEHMGIIGKRGRNYYCKDKLTNLHMRDAIRHGAYFFKYGTKERK
jgi:hypothetical protein